MAKEFQKAVLVKAGKGQKEGKSLVKDVTADVQKALKTAKGIIFLAFDTRFAGSQKLDENGKPTGNISIATTGKRPMIVVEEEGGTFVGVHLHAMRLDERPSEQVSANDFSL